MEKTKSNEIKTFLDILASAIRNGTFQKCTLGKMVKKNQEIQKGTFRPVVIAGNKMITFTYRHPTNDITKNHPPQEVPGIVGSLLAESFLQANLFSTEKDVQLMISKKGQATLKSMKPSTPILEVFSHDRIKQRLIDPKGKKYLTGLGITNKEFQVIPTMNSKFRQINKFIEIISSVLPETPPQNEFSVVDMGSGKGYLTFALYDYLVNTLKYSAKITGIEHRDDLVKKCNRIAEASSFDGLNFEKSNIVDYKLPATEMLIALHACDTATDDAIFKGISAKAKYIIVAPCCHKQVRKSMQPGPELQPLLKHGIYLERQAELLTDGIRGLILEKHGYKIKSLEFISTEHTPKNVMIIAAKSDQNVDKDKISLRISELKRLFGIDYHYLESLLEGY
jgi:hypothetical protein